MCNPHYNQKPCEHQHSWGKWYSEIMHKNDSCWRICEKLGANQKIEHTGKELGQKVNLIIIENKLLTIIQLKQSMIFSEILNRKKCKKFSKHYNFYENSHIIKPHQILTKDNHHIRIHSKLVGGAVINYLNEIMFNDYSQLKHFHKYFT
jgi:hypothetical protein